ncbi:hypothetical protein MMC30_002436 [Trapelia coarctata]|nr:hypothetical protein [Trapelia coarctata]
MSSPGVLIMSSSDVLNASTGFELLGAGFNNSVPISYHQPLSLLSLSTAFASSKSASFHASLQPLVNFQPAQIAVALPVSILLVIISVYVSTWLSYLARRSSKDAVKEPPVIPYMLPFVGSALSFGLSPSKCVAAAMRTVGSQRAYGMKVFNDTLYFINGPENMGPIWKYKTSITSPGIQTFCLIRVFGMCQKAVNMYSLDTSGILPKPTSDVAEHNRIDYHTHADFQKLLNGDRLANLYRRWSTSFTNRLQSMGVEKDWAEFPDIVDFWMPSMTTSLNEAMAGPILECINPNFTRDFLKFFPYVHGLMKGLPKMFLPEAFQLRDSLNRDVKQWHSLARTLFKESDIDADGDADPYWGSGSIRERQKMLLSVDNWDHDAVAASDFGLLWGANINVHTAALWMIVEIFKDKDLLTRVRTELKAANLDRITLGQDIDTLLSLPLLQAVHAEVLRLRVEVQSVFYSEREDIRINEWRFPKKSLVLVPTGPAHRDTNVWNTQDGARPLDTFWADRFLAYPNDPRSGPIRKPAALAEKPIRQKSNNEPKFISNGMADFYMPYGVGERTCPGRFFARREMVAFCAKIVNEFDVEILSREKDFKSNTIFYGLGTQRPLNRIPFKIRKRELDC